MVRFLGVVPSRRQGKKYDGVFMNDRGKKVIVSFGADGYEDYTMHKNVERMRLYQRRHQHDRLHDPMTPGSLSWFVLWSAPTLQKGITNYKKQFGFV